MILEIRSPALVRIRKGLPFPISLVDDLRFEKTDKRQIALVREEGFRFPTNDQNMVYQAASELHRFALGRMGVRITIRKNIPPGKGLGSWASASAQAMGALNKLWNLGFSEKRLMEIAKKANPSIAAALKIHHKSQKHTKPAKASWAIVAIPSLIRIDRGWIAKISAQGRQSMEGVAESHFPDLVAIRRTLGRIGWAPVGMSGMGPSLVGLSGKRIGISRIPKKIRSKLGFVWVGKCL